MAGRVAVPEAPARTAWSPAAHARRVPRACPPLSALPRAEGPGHQLYSRLRSHRQRLEHLVSSGATSAADLAPVVSELRQIAADIPASAGSWARMREQLQSLERALASTSASESQRGTFGDSVDSSSGESSCESSVDENGSECSDSSSCSMQAAPGLLRVRMVAGGAVDLAVPDWDDGPATQPAPAPRLAAAGTVLVCTGRKCCAQGADATLAAARGAAAGSRVEVVASKCMGKCGRGPCVRLRVEGLEGSALTKGVGADAAELLLRQQFGVEC